MALTRKGRYAEAVGPYQEAVRLKPDYQNAYSNLGAALSILGRDREAIAAHHKALALEPDDRSEIIRSAMPISGSTT